MNLAARMTIALLLVAFWSHAECYSNDDNIRLLYELLRAPAYREGDPALLLAGGLIDTSQQQQQQGAGAAGGLGDSTLMAMRQQRKAAAASPSLRLRFGKRDNDIENIVNNEELLPPVLDYLTSELEMARRAPSMRLRFGKRFDPEEMSNRSWRRLPSKVLRYGRSAPKDSSQSAAATTKDN